MASRNLLNLPQETIDHILSFLVPHTPLESVRPLKHQLSHLNPDEWREDAMNLRRTCRYFSDVVAPSLFHDVYLYPIEFSLDRLTELSKSPHLKTAVKRIVFMRPQFEEKLRSLKHYQEAREGGMQAEFEKCFGRIRGNHHYQHEAEGGPSFDIPKLPRHYFEHQAKRLARDEAFLPLLKDGHAAYLSGLDEQKKLLESEKYVWRGALLMKKMPNLTSFVLSGGNGVKEGLSSWPACRLQGWLNNARKNFLEKRYPLVQLDRQSPSSWSSVAEQAFVTAVVQMLHHAEVPITELLFPTCLGIRPSMQLSQQTFWHGLQLQNLKRLNLYLKLEKSESSELDGANIDALLGPALVNATLSLEALTLRINSDPYAERHKIAKVEASVVFKNIWPRLEEIAFTGVIVKNTSITRFLKDNPTIKKFSMINVWFERRVWRGIFNYVRGRKDVWLAATRCSSRMPSAERNGTTITFLVSTFAPDPDEEDFVFLGHVRGDQCGPELRAFLAGVGPWTDSLARVFGGMST